MGDFLEVTAPEIDPTEAIEAFMNAADYVEAFFPVAIKNYQQQIAYATALASEQFERGHFEAAPFVDTAKVATDELRQFLGLAPISYTKGLSDVVRDVNRLFRLPYGGGAPGITTTIEDAANLMYKAERGLTTEERVGYKNQALDLLDSAITGIETDWYYYGSRVPEADRTAGEVIQQKLEGGMTGPFNIQWDNNENYQDRGTYGGSTYLAVATDQMRDAQRNAGTYSGSEPDTWRAEAARQIAENRVSNLLRDSEEAYSRLKEYKTQFETEFSDDPLVAYTSEEIADKLVNLPEYQFQFNQGSKALERTQAARGVLQSGNALVEAEEFGQGLAERTYQTHLQQLSSLAGLNLPLVSQDIGNLNNQGLFYANQQNMSAAQGYQNAVDIARSRESAFIRKGQTLFDAASLNAQMNLQAQIANQQAALTAAQIGAAGGGGGGGGLGGIGQIAGALIGGLF